MPIDLLEQKREPVDLLADEQPEEKRLSLVRGSAPSMSEKIFDLFRDPAKEKAKAVNAIVDSEALGIRPDVAYQFKSSIDKYYQIRPENTKRREKVLSDIKRFNDMGGTEDEWHTVLLKNAKQVPYQMQIAAGGIMRMFEENPDGVYAMLGMNPTENDMETFKLASEAREKKSVRTLSDEVVASGVKGIEKNRAKVMPGSFKDTAGMATQSALNNLIFLAPGMFMGRAVPLFGMGSQAFGQSYIEQREGGSTPSTAMLASLVKGGSEIATEFIPVGIYLKPKASFVRSLAAAELTEIPTETVNQIVNDVTDKVTIRPDMTAEEAIDNIMQTIQVTALSTPGISGVTYSAHKVIGKALLLSEHKDTFDNAKNAALMDGATPQAALKAGIDAVSETPEGSDFVENKVNELKKEASEVKAPENKQPFIFGVQEDANGEVTGFTMADPESGQTFDVPAMKSEDKEKMSIAPDAEAVKKAMAEIKEAGTMDAQLDRIIEGQEDIDEASGQLFQDDIDEMGFVNEVFTEEDAKPETVLDRVKQINDRIGEKGSIDLEPLVNLGLSIMAEGHQTLEAFTARAKELLSDVWDKVKDFVSQAWNMLNNERGSFSTKKVSTDDINMMLSAAARQDAATGGNITPESYLDLRAQAAQKAFSVIEKKMTRAQRREAAALARQGEADARLMPTYSAMSHIVNAGGMSLKSLQADYDGNTIRELMNKRPGLVSNKGTMGPDVFADQHGFESGDDMINAILDWRGLKAEGKAQSQEFLDYYEKAIGKADFEAYREEFDRQEQKALDELTKKYKPKAAKGIKKEIRRRTGQEKAGDRMVTEYSALTEAFRKEANTARRAFAEGKKEEVERSKEVMRWLVKRRESMKNVRDYFGLTDAEMMRATNRRNPALMDDAEFKQFLRNVELKAVELAETRQEKMALLKLIEDKRLKKVDNYRQALELPTFNEMNAQQLREFAKLLEPFQDDDVFLTQRELETVDRTDLKGIKTWREARERLAKEAGVDVEELEKVHVEAIDSFRWDSSLRERDPFFDILVSRMTEAILGAELRTHEVENQAYELAKKSEKSRNLGIVEKMVPQDDLIMAFLESPMDKKAAIVEQMTPEQINYANFMQSYFAEALNYLIATKSLERGRENYFVHIRKTFLENLKDGGLKKAVSEIFKSYQQDQMMFNILDDDTGNILPLEKFFQFSLQRTDTMDPTRNVTKAFLTYMRTFEKKKMFDAIIPKLDIYAQSLTPTRYTPRGLEIDRSLKTFVNKWINNKKGRRISFDSTLRQGGPLDVGIRALRTFTTILDLGLSPVAQVAALAGEQVTNAAMLGNKGMAQGTARMATDKGKRIIEKYRSFVGRSLWEEFTAPGKEIQERLSQVLFAGFHVSSVMANKQYLLASMTEQEFEAEEISTERLAQMRLDMGRFRVVPGTGSIVGSTSVGDAAMQYKKWAVPIARTLITDGQALYDSIGKKKAGEVWNMKETQELMRFVYFTAAVFIVGAMAGADDKEDKSFIGKAKFRLYRESMSLIQAIGPGLWVASPRIGTWIGQTVDALKSMVLLETYKSCDKEGELKGDDKLRKQFIPGAVRSLGEEK